MSSITFLVSIFGRHGDRGGDLHRQRDQKRTEHVLCQEQGECFFFFVFCSFESKVFFLVSYTNNVKWYTRNIIINI